MSVATQAQAEWLGVFDKARLTPRYFVTLALLVLQEMFEFYDLFIVGYLVSVLAPGWHLTYGQSSLMLLSAGVGAIVGALCFGRWADRFGRRTLIALGGLVFSIGGGACALMPDGSWLLFSACRFLVGFGMAGAVATQNTLVVEITPTRYRTFLSSMMMAPVGLGAFFAALASSQLLPIIGWRGLAATCAIPVLVSLGVWLWAPESVRWLLTRGRFADARREAARQLGVPVEEVKLPSAPPQPPEPAPLSELMRDRRRFWWVIAIWGGASTSTYGVQLWGPTLLALLLSIPAKDAAGYFVGVAVFSTLGRVMFAVLPMWIGRRRSGELMGYGSAAIMLGCALFYRDTLFGWNVFALLIVFGAAIYSGGFANLTPYTVEAHPVHLGARALGLGQAANGVGKILGPLCLALIAGSSDVVTPKATTDAIMPAFLFLTACSLISAVAFTLFRVETHGRPLTLRDAPAPVLTQADNERHLAGGLK